MGIFKSQKEREMVKRDNIKLRKLLKRYNKKKLEMRKLSPQILKESFRLNRISK